MTAKEKRLLNLMLLIFFLGVLPFALIPEAMDYYKAFNAHIDKLNADIENYEKLSSNAQFWEDRHRESITLRNDINTRLITGNSRPALQANLQSTLRHVAQKTNVTIRSMEVTEFSPTAQWMLITQTVQLEAQSNTLFNFLTDLQKTQERLIVVKLDVNAGREILNVNIKITGFSQIPPDEPPVNTVQHRNPFPPTNLLFITTSLPHPVAS